MTDKKIRMFGVVKESITDGPGLRYAVFVQGCPHHCVGCHNPTTHPFSGGTMMSVTEIFEDIIKNPLLSGVTLSGGEPFSQAAELIPLAERIKGAKLELAIYTGYLFEDLIKDETKTGLLRFADIVVDGKFEEAKKSLELNFKGSTNQRTLDVQKSLKFGIACVTQDQRWITKGGDFYKEIPLI